MASLALLALGACCLVPLVLLGLLAAVVHLMFRLFRSERVTGPKTGDPAEAGEIVEGEYRELHEVRKEVRD